MSFSLSQITSLAKILASNPTEAKAILKLASVEILKNLGSNKYSVLLESKTLTAQSDKPLSEGAKYWSQITQGKDSLPNLSNLVKMPKLLTLFQNAPQHYTLKDLATLLNSPKPEATLKQALMEQLTNATSKEEFTNSANLLLSLQNQTMTIPLQYQNYFSILQMKKRYNKKTKKSQIDFYAALEFLGPISGIVSLENESVSVNLNVAFEKTKTFLEENMNQFSYTITITLAQNISPLYEANINSLLDVSI